MLTEATLRSSTIVAWMAEAGAAVRAHRDQLTQLDAAIGDGDHGTNMVRGFDAVEQALAGRGEDAPGRVLVACGKTLVATVGGASGPLWGSALRRAGRSLGDTAEIDGAQLAVALDAALTAIRELGAAEVGDKTIVDALAPATAALRTALGAGGEHLVGQCGQHRGGRVRGLEDRRDGRPAVLEHGALDRRLQLGVAGHQCPGLQDLGVGGVQRARERVQLVGGRLQSARGDQRRGGPLLERHVRVGAGQRVQDDRAAGGQAGGGGQTLEHVSHLARRCAPALA